MLPHPICPSQKGSSLTQTLPPHSLQIATGRSPAKVSLAPVRAISPTRWLKGIALALGAFAVLGTVAALWENPFFIRMTAVGDWEVGLLLFLSVLGGLYFALRQARCGTRAAGAGGVLGFLGIACPVCNKVLLLLFGGEALLTYFEPIRIYVAGAGSLLVATAIVLEYRRQLQAGRIT